MAKLPIDVQNALKRQAPKALRRDFEKEINKKFKDLKNEMMLFVQLLHNQILKML